MVTDNLKSLSTSKRNYTGRIQVLFDLDLINRVGYAYDDDHFGAKSQQTYGKRKNLVDLVEDINGPDGYNNEVLIKNYVAPQFIRGFLIDDGNKLAFIKILREQGLIQENEKGQECIYGKLLSEFIFSYYQFEKKMWNK
jgi:hypothetical protein